MGTRPLLLEADKIYSQTQRTVDRQFLFHPDPAVRNIIGASAARAQMKHPVKIMWIEFNINHEHAGVAPLSESEGHLTNVVLFKKTFHRILAEELNRYYGREGAVFSSAPRTTPCLDDLSVEQQFFYALTNPVKDGLVDRVAQWGGFSSYPALARGKDEVFIYYDRTAWNKQKAKKNAKPLQAFAKHGRIEYSPLPAWEEMPEGKRQSHIRREVRKLEKKFREERKQEGRGVVGLLKLEKTDPRDRPKTRPARSPKPLCHSSCPDLAREYRADFYEYWSRYKVASGLYRSGFLDVEFPRGSIRPPLIQVCVPKAA